MKYIQRKDREYKTLETIDEFETHKEAKAMLKEYQISDNSAEYYISQRACKEWKTNPECKKFYSKGWHND